LDAGLVVVTSVTLQGLLAPAEPSPDDPAGEPNPAEGEREIQVALHPFAHRLQVLDTGPEDAEIEEVYEMEL
jgi:hypothetical protein